MKPTLWDLQELGTVSRSPGVLVKELRSYGVSEELVQWAAQVRNDTGHCVLGAWLMRLYGGGKYSNFPDPAVCSEIMQDHGVPTMFADEYSYIIAEANDNGDFDTAWLYMDKALGMME